MAIASADIEDPTAGQPPHAPEAEQAALGGMLLSTDAIVEATALLRAEDFYRPANQAVFAAACDLHDRGEPADPITVGAELERRGEFSRVGGAPYLLTLIGTVATAINVGYYAKIVADKADLRRMQMAGITVAQWAESANRVGGATADVESLASRVQEELDRVTDRRNRRTAVPGFVGVAAERMAHLRALQAGEIEPGLRTGFADLDELLSGLKPGQLIVVAARPGVGKSTLAMDWGRYAAFKTQETAAIFSLEMSIGELWDRAMCAEARVRLSDYRRPETLNAEDWRRINRRLTELSEPCANRDGALGDLLRIDDDASATPATIRARARQIQQQQGLSLIVVDYLQLMSTTRPHSNREQEVSELSRQMKLLAKDLQVPVVLLSQLNRAAEARSDKRPLLADLRESGAIEQDADIVLLLHRPDYYDRNDPRAGETDLIVAKNRGGPTGTVSVAHQLHYGRFADLAQAI